MNEEALERAFAELERDPAQDLGALAARLGLAEAEVRACAAAFGALEQEARVVPPPWSPRAGERLLEYELVEPIGRGGMGVVWRARDPAAGREVAIKLARELRDAGTAGARLAREAQAMAGLRHPGVCAVHGAGEWRGVPYLVLELVEGARTLERAWEGLELKARVALVRDAARALGAAHAQGIVHRDVKPQNLLVDRAGRMRVTDFGLALGLELERLTRTGEAAGTPTHMSPEQIAGGEVGAPTDVWALGVVLHQAATGELPFRAETVHELVARIHCAQPDPIPGLSPALDAIRRRALARDPAQRFPHGEALAAALDAFLADPGAPPPRSAAPLAVAAAAVALLAGTAALLYPREVPSPAPAAPPAPEAPAPAESSAPAPPLPTPKPLRLRTGESEESLGLFAPGGDALTLGRGEPGEVQVWSARQGFASLGAWLPPASIRDAAVLAGAPIRVAIVSRTGAWLAGLEGERVERIDTGSWRAVAALEDEAGRPLLALGADDPWRLVLRRPDSPEQLHVRAGRPGERLAALVASPDGRRLALLLRHEQDAHRVLVLDPSGAELAALSPLPGPSAAAFSPDGARLAIGCRDGLLLLADLSRGAPPVQLPPGERAHADAVRGVAFSSDGRRLWSAGGRAPGTLRAFDLPEGRPLATRVLEASPAGLQLSPDGEWLLVALDAGGAELLPARD